MEDVQSYPRQRREREAVEVSCPARGRQPMASSTLTCRRLSLASSRPSSVMDGMHTERLQEQQGLRAMQCKGEETGKERSNGTPAAHVSHELQLAGSE